MVQTKTDDSSWEDGAVVIDPMSLDTAPASSQRAHIDSEHLLQPEERDIHVPPAATSSHNVPADGSPPFVPAVPVMVPAESPRPTMATAEPDISVPSEITTTPTTPPNSAQDDSLDPNSILAQSIQNTLKFSSAAKEPEVASNGGEAVTGGAEKNDDGDETSSATENATEKKDNPGLWKLAGRKIKQYKVGKSILNGIRDGYDISKKTLGIGVGHIVICVPGTQFYQPESKVTGTIEFDLSEPIQATALVLELKGFQERQTINVSSSSISRSHQRPHHHHHREQKQVYRMEYVISGKQEYPTHGRFPFEVLVPRLRRQMSQETKTSLVGSVISSVQAISASMSSPVEWYLVANLVIPGRLNMSHKVRIHVADEAY